MSTLHQHTAPILDQNEPDIPDWFYLVFGMLLVIFSGIEAKGQNLSFNNSIPSSLIVCEEDENFTIEFTNTSSELLSNVEVLLDFPAGVEYVGGSIVESSNYNVQESDISNLSEVVFSSNNLPSGGTITFSVEALANFDAYTNQLNGNIFSNQVIVSFSTNTESDFTDFKI